MMSAGEKGPFHQPPPRKQSRSLQSSGRNDFEDLLKHPPGKGWRLQVLMDLAGHLPLSSP
jgi:hypothetical protein